jgi:hypothetical protein
LAQFFTWLSLAGIVKFAFVFNGFSIFHAGGILVAWDVEASCIFNQTILWQKF